MTGTEAAGRAAPARDTRDDAVRQETLRRHNLSLVLRHVLDAPVPLSRSNIAARTGLARATVSALVDRLMTAGMVTELPPVVTRRAGRPGVPLVPGRGTFAAIGLEVNVSYLGARALDLSGDVLVDRMDRADFRRSSPDRVLDLLADLAREVVSELVTRGTRLVGIGIALPGLVDRGTGTLRLAPNLGWRDVELAGVLARPPFSSVELLELGNEANLAAWAEAQAHAEPNASFIYVSGEVGIGGGLVFEGQVLQGQRGWSGELGHTTVEPDGLLCACGARGCLEQYAGKSAVMTAAGLDPTGPIEALVEQMEARNPAARAALDRAGSALGLALSNVVNIVDVDEVVLGGIYAPLAGYLAPAVISQLEARVLSAPWSRPHLGPATHGQHAAMTGAALSLLRAVASDPTAWGAGV